MSDNFAPFAKNIYTSRYAHEIKNGLKENWHQIAHRVVHNVMGAVKAPPRLVKEIEIEIRERRFMPGGRYLYASGRPFHQTQNCLLLRAEDTREGWGKLFSHAALALMTGAGIGVDYSALRPEGMLLRGSGGTASGPLPCMQAVNELGRAARQGGHRRGAIWAGMKWNHKDILKFIHAKDWPEAIKALKAEDFNFPAFLDFTNISVQLDDRFFEAWGDNSDPEHGLAHIVYWETVHQMCRSGEPGFSIDCGENEGETLRNACTEITSRDDSDICNIGSVNMSRIKSLAQMRKTVSLGTAFLLAGSVYSDVPYPEVAEVRTKNRRIGLGLMGLHEWLAMRGKPYAPDTDLRNYLEVYERESEQTANRLSDELGISRPVKYRAIAPTGTISIVAETTSGVEPIFAAAYKRRYRAGVDAWKYELVIDPSAQRLIHAGVKPETIQDAYSISPEARVDFQAWLQWYVDHGISSTINLPAWGSEGNNESTVRPFGLMLFSRLPRLRGITVYPDAARGGQPLTRIPLSEALGHEGEVFSESIDVCDLTRSGSCGN